MRPSNGARWLFACVFIQLVCALALLVKELAPIRVVIRSAALGTSLAFLFVVPGRIRTWNVVHLFGLGALAVLLLAMLNPLGGVPLSVLAHWAFCLAVIAPLFWIARLDIPRGTVGRMLLFLWGFHTLGSCIGVLQVLFPGRFQLSNLSAAEHQNLLIQLSSGEWMLRPSGLTDTPGGAGANGLYACLFGSGVVLARPFRFARAAGAVSMCLGLICIYMSQVRASLVMLVVCFVVLTTLLSVSGRGSRATFFTLLIAIAAFIGFYFALSLGGQMMSTRLSSLVATDPGNVYYSNRGRMLELTFNEYLPRYPFGAGLGHWGMVNAYFGSAEQEIGAEIQITGWVLDGGVPLLIAYPAAVLAAIVHSFRASQLPDDSAAIWASVVGAYSVGALALCFSYPLFMGSSGLEFWIVNGLLLQELPLRRRAG